MSKVSIVVPVYNEEGNVEELHKEILDVCIKNKSFQNLEISFLISTLSISLCIFIESYICLVSYM